MAAYVKDESSKLLNVAVEGWLIRPSTWPRNTSGSRLFYRLYENGAMCAYTRRPESNNIVPKAKNFIGLSPAAQIVDAAKLPEATSFAIVVPKDSSGSSSPRGNSFAFQSIGDFDAGTKHHKEQWLVALRTVTASLTAELVSISESTRIARNLLKKMHQGKEDSMSALPEGMNLVPPPSVMTDDTNSFADGFSDDGDKPKGVLMHWGIVSMRRHDPSQPKKSNWLARDGGWQSRCLEIYDDGELRIYQKSRGERRRGDKAEIVTLHGTEDVHVRTQGFVPHFAFDVKSYHGMPSGLAKTIQIRTGDMRELKDWVCSFHYALEAVEQKRKKEPPSEGSEGAADGRPPSMRSTTRTTQWLSGYLAEDLGNKAVPRESSDHSLAGVAVLTWNMNETLPSQEDTEYVLGKMLYSNRSVSSVSAGLPWSDAAGESFSHYGPDGTWSPYTAAQAKRISEAIVRDPRGGSVLFEVLAPAAAAADGGDAGDAGAGVAAADESGGDGGKSKSGFEVRWGTSAQSERMPTAPKSGMIQINLANGNTRVVRRYRSSERSSKGGAADTNLVPNRIVVVGTQECRPISVTAISFNSQVSTWNKRCGDFFKSKGLFPLAQENLAATTISVFVHSSIFHKISSVEVSTVPCGLGGVLLNKGGVGVALQLFETRMCFISSHLAAHQHKVLKRHADYYRITSEIFHGGLYEDGRKPLAVSSPSGGGAAAGGEGASVAKGGVHDKEEEDDDDDEEERDESMDADDYTFGLEFPGLADLALTSRGRQSSYSERRTSFRALASQQSFRKNPSLKQLTVPTRGHSEATLMRLGTRRDLGEITLEEYSRGAQQLVHESLHKLVEDGLLDSEEYNAMIEGDRAPPPDVVDPEGEDGGEAERFTVPQRRKDTILSDQAETHPEDFTPPATINQLRLVDLFDCVFFCGDMNYRVDSTKAKVEEQLLAKFGHQRSGSVVASATSDFSGAEKAPTSASLRWLTDRDQLNKARTVGQVFQGFDEGALRFKPTFKFDNDSNRYDTSAKERVPSWCDRILYKPSRCSLLDYDSVMDVMHSDHRPVIALYDVNLE